jgi:MFS family permease
MSVNRVVLILAAVLAVAGGSLNDMYDHIERGYTFPIYAGAGFMGPLVAPIIGCTITQLWDWRWCYYLNGIIGCVLSVFLSISCPETLADIILFQKAHRIWKANRDTDFYGLKVRKPERKKTSPKQFARCVRLTIYLARGTRYSSPCLPNQELCCSRRSRCSFSNP